MKINGIDALHFGVEDMEVCTKFCDDWGLQKIEASESQASFQTQDGGMIKLMPIGTPSLPPAFETGSTLRRVIWGVESESDLAEMTDRIQPLDGFAMDVEGPSITDPTGMRVTFRVSEKHDTAAEGSVMNTINEPGARSNKRAAIYERAAPVTIGHVVFFAPDAAGTAEFYQKQLGFYISDYYPEGGYFLRCREVGGHHNLFLLQTPDKKQGLNHVAFSVRDIHEVFGGGLHISRCGWETQIGPGRHPISSAYFWYVHNPAGGLAEYYADEDWCEEDWEPQAWDRTPENYAEWAVAGGIDGKTRRQVNKNR